MRNEMDFDFDNIDDFEPKHETSILMYDKGGYGETGELIQRLAISNLQNMSIDYKNKIFHAEHVNGKVYDISFYKMVIV